MQPALCTLHFEICTLHFELSTVHLTVTNLPPSAKSSSLTLLVLPTKHSETLNSCRSCCFILHIPLNSHSLFVHAATLHLVHSSRVQQLVQIIGKKLYNVQRAKFKMQPRALANIFLTSALFGPAPCSNN